MIETICINDANKPKEIPSSKWIVKDEKYRITHISIHPNQNNIQGCTLYEKPLGTDCHPYEFFKLSRFAIKEEDIDKLIELMKNCTELNDVDILELIKESELELI